MAGVIEERDVRPHSFLREAVDKLRKGVAADVCTLDDLEVQGLQHPVHGLGIDPRVLELRGVGVFPIPDHQGDAALGLGWKGKAQAGEQKSNEGTKELHYTLRNVTRYKERNYLTGAYRCQAVHGCPAPGSRGRKCCGRTALPRRNASG